MQIEQDTIINPAPAADTALPAEVVVSPPPAKPAVKVQTVVANFATVAAPADSVIAAEDTVGQAEARRQAIEAMPRLGVAPYSMPANFMAETYGRHHRTFRQEQWWTSDPAGSMAITGLPHNTYAANMAFLGLFAIFSILIWAKMWYDKQLHTLIGTLLNAQLIHKAWANPNTTNERVSYFLNINSFLVFGLFSYLAVQVWHVHPQGIPHSVMLLALIAFWVAVYFIQQLAFRLFGYILSLGQVFEEYFFHIQYINKSAGLLLLPFALAMGFVSANLSQGVFWSAMVLLSGLYLLRLWRGLKIFMASGLLKVHLLLYLCTLEIMPVLVCYKLIRSMV